MSALDDRTGGPCYNKNDRVRQEWQWRERVGEEVKYLNTNPNFQMNLIRPLPNIDRIKYSHNRIELVTEKEHKNSPQIRAAALGTAGRFSEDSYEVQTIQHLNKKPTQKWDLPMTSSNDVGWLLAQPARADNLVTSMNSARSTTIPTLTNGKWNNKDKAPAMKPSGEHLPDIHKLNTPRWKRPKEKSDVSKYSITTRSSKFAFISDASN